MSKHPMEIWDQEDSVTEKLAAANARIAELEANRDYWHKCAVDWNHNRDLEVLRAQELADALEYYAPGARSDDGERARAALAKWREAK